MASRMSASSSAMPSNIALNSPAGTSTISVSSRFSISRVGDVTRPDTRSSRLCASIFFARTAHRPRSISSQFSTEWM